MSKVNFYKIECSKCKKLVHLTFFFERKYYCLECFDYNLIKQEDFKLLKSKMLIKELIESIKL